MPAKIAVRFKTLAGKSCLLSVVTPYLRRILRRNPAFRTRFAKRFYLFCGPDREPSGWSSDCLTASCVANYHICTLLCL